MAADEHPPVSVPDLVELMYRADWSTLSLALEAAEFDDYDVRSRMMASHAPPWLPLAGPAAGRRQAGLGPDDEEADVAAVHAVGDRTFRLLIEPGGRFRADSTAGKVDDDVPPCAELLLPSWLPAGFELVLAGPALVSGRRAYRVTGSQRPVGRGRRLRPGRQRLRPAHRTGAFVSRIEDIDRVDAVIDADLGILLRAELLFRGQVVSRREFTTVLTDPRDAPEVSQSAGPLDEDEPDAGPPFSGPGWERAKTAANAGAAALSFAIRHSPHRAPPAGARPGAPPGSPRPGQAGWPGPPGPDQPLSGRLIRLLYEAGLRRTGFDAELATWADAAASADSFKWATRNSTLPAVSQLGDAFTERATSWQGREAVSVELPDKYRIDYIDGGAKPRKVISEVSNGTRRWRIFADHASVGAALPLPEPIARLADPSWLLDWRLTGGAEVTVGDRDGYLIRVHPRCQPPEAAAHAGLPADVILDAELGVLLRLNQEQAGRPSMQQSLVDLTVRTQHDPATFGVEVPAAMRVVRDSGTMLDQMELPAAAQTAVQLGVKALSAAARFGGFVSSKREQREQREQRKRQGQDGG